MSINTKNQICLVAALLVFGVSFAAEMRIWTLADGSRIEAAYHKQIFGDVMVKDASRKTHLIRMEDLSKSDLRYIHCHVPPKVSGDIEYHTRELPRTEYTRDGEKTTLYTFEGTIKKESKQPYKGNLTAELFIFGRERTVKGDRYCVLMHYAKKPVAFPEEGRSTCTFEVPDVKFYAYKATWVHIMNAVNRGQTYLGYILTIMDSKGCIIYTDENISGFDWLTDDVPASVEKLRILYADNPGSPQSRHFNDKFCKVGPPRIPWFVRSNK